MIEARNITYSVAGRTIISDVSVRFEPGRLHLVIGPNGAGKSTLVKLLAGFLRPESGSVEHDGKNIQKTGELEMARRRAVLSQAVEIAFPLSVREVVMMGRYPHFGGRPGPADESVVEEMLGYFDIGELRDRNYQTLSGGERQRVNFARVLGQLWRKPDRDEDTQPGCRYLFLDEPLTFLDIRHQIEFMKKVRSFNEAPDIVTVGVVHDLNLAARFADQIVLLDHGRVVAAGTASEVLDAGRIREVFGVELTFITFGAAGVHLVFD